MSTVWRTAFAAAACVAACDWAAGAQPAASASASASAASAGAERVQVWRLSHGELPSAQRLVAVLKGERLRWQITSDSAGDVHLHGYRLGVHVQPGQTAELTFIARATGRFPVEWHAADDRAAPTSPHAAPLAFLEVRPP